MAGTGRNQPCSCGSGIKAKRCCGVARGPSEDQLATAFLHEQAGQWASTLVDYTDTELDELRNEVFRLPDTFFALHLPLPKLLPPALERLRRAVADDDRDAVTAAFPDAVAAVDKPGRRARLARTVLELHDDDHRLDCDATAYAVLDLAENGVSVLMCGALRSTLAVATGSARTPSGLLVASR